MAEPRDRELADLLWQALPPEGRAAWAGICRLLGPDERAVEAQAALRRVAGVLLEAQYEMGAKRVAEGLDVGDMPLNTEQEIQEAALALVSKARRRRSNPDP